MEIRKFAKITDPIEAVQFTGGQENGEEIVAWVKENGRGARWLPEVKAIGEEDDPFGIPAEAEKIQLRTPRGIKVTLVGWWIYKDDKGDFRAMSEVEINTGYTPV